MKKVFFIVPLLLVLIGGCSSSKNVCEDVTLASEQIKQCQILKRQITQAKGRPVYRTELERRYQKNCIEIRFYRDDQQAAICGNKHKIKEIRKSAKEESKQY